MLGAVLRLVERAVEQGLVLDDAVDLDAARAREHDPRPRVVDPHRELVRRKATEHDRVDRAETGAGEHGEHGLRDHRHVDDDRVALADAEPARARRPGAATSWRSSAVGVRARRPVTGLS